MNPWLPAITHLRWAIDLALHAARAPRDIAFNYGWPEELMSHEEKLDYWRRGRQHAPKLVVTPGVTLQ